MKLKGQRTLDGHQGQTNVQDKHTKEKITKSLPVRRAGILSSTRALHARGELRGGVAQKKEPGASCLHIQINVPAVASPRGLARPGRRSRRQEQHCAVVTARWQGRQCSKLL